MFKFWELTADWSVAGALSVPAFVGAVTTAVGVSAGFGPDKSVIVGLVFALAFTVIWNIIVLLSTGTVAILGITINLLGAVSGYFVNSIMLNATGSVGFSPVANLALAVCIYSFLMLGVYVVLYAGAMYSQTQMVLQKALAEQKKYEALNASGYDEQFKDLGEQPPETEEKDGSKKD